MKNLFKLCCISFLLGCQFAGANSCELYKENKVKLDSEELVLIQANYDKAKLRQAILGEKIENLYFESLSGVEHAVLMHDLDLVKQLYLRDSSNSEFVNAARLAALIGDNDIFKYFLFKTDLLNELILSKNVSNPIFDAIKNDNIEAVCMIYERSKNLASINRAGRSVFAHAALHGSLKSLLYILSKGYILTKSDREALPGALNYLTMKIAR